MGYFGSNLKQEVVLDIASLSPGGVGSHDVGVCKLTCGLQAERARLRRGVSCEATRPGGRVSRAGKTTRSRGAGAKLG